MPTSLRLGSAVAAFVIAMSIAELGRACVGDCNGDVQVTIGELITAVNIALGQAKVATCPAADRNHDGKVRVAELVNAVESSLTNCQNCPAGSPCLPGNTKTDGCGRCGMQNFTCNGNCKWETTGQCDGQHGECEGGQQETQSCAGNCSTQTRTCDPNSCTWGAYGSCSPSGECSPGSTESCGYGSPDNKRTCQSDCQWTVCGCGLNDYIAKCPFPDVCGSDRHIGTYGPPNCGLGLYSAYCFKNCGSEFEVCSAVSCPAGYSVVGPPHSYSTCIAGFGDNPTSVTCRH